MVQLNRTSCCGLREISGLGGAGTSRNALYEVAKIMYTNSKKGAFVVFSAPSQHKYGDNLRNLITKTRVGTVSKSRARKNPNSLNTLNVYMWSVNDKVLKRWYIAEKKRLEKPIKTLKFKDKGKTVTVYNWGHMFSTNSTAESMLGLTKYIYGDSYYYDNNRTTPTECLLINTARHRGMVFCGVLAPNGIEYIVSDQALLPCQI